MSRSGYTDGCGGWELILWRGAVASAIKGKRGQKFLIEMLAALDAMPEKKLIKGELKNIEGQVCALGSVGSVRGIDMSVVDTEDREEVGKTFNISGAMAAEIQDINDQDLSYNYVNETPEERFMRVRAWVIENIKESSQCLP